MIGKTNQSYRKRQFDIIEKIDECHGSAAFKVHHRAMVRRCRRDSHLKNQIALRAVSAKREISMDAKVDNAGKCPVMHGAQT
ncbi:MAG: hypothetical protein WCC66_00375, partial [Rhizobiaceae bacterium]